MLEHGLDIAMRDYRLGTAAALASEGRAAARLRVDTQGLDRSAGPGVGAGAGTSSGASSDDDLAEFRGAY